MPTRTYTAVFEPQPEGGYTVHVPALPGCLTEGETLGEARRRARDAIRAYCASLAADDATLPAQAATTDRTERLRVTLP